MLYLGPELFTAEGGGPLTGRGTLPAAITDVLVAHIKWLFIEPRGVGRRELESQLRGK